MNDSFHNRERTDMLNKDKFANISFPNSDNFSFYSCIHILSKNLTVYNLDNESTKYIIKSVSYLKILCQTNYFYWKHQFLSEHLRLKVPYYHCAVLTIRK